MNNFSITEDSKLIISINDEKEKLCNNKSYKFLSKKRDQINSLLKNIQEEKEKEEKEKEEKEKEENYLISYYALNPIKLVKNPNMKFKINKDDLNKFFLESKGKKENKEIYYSELYKLINPYYLIQERKYINKKYISKENLETLEEEKEALIERDNNKCSNKYYDRNKKILFELPRNQREFNHIKNNELIKNCIDEKYLVVRIANCWDDFNEILLLKPNFGLDELIILIRFLYKAKYGQNSIKSFHLFDHEDYKDGLDLEQIKTLKDLYKKIKPEKPELSIYIDAQY